MDEFIWCKIKQWFLIASEEERKESEKPIPFFVSLLYSRELLVFDIALTYSSIAPIM
jgi:hypothetical protein